MIGLKVSIIIPTFNRAHLICQTLDSICQQSYKNWECIIVDDCSTDQSETIIQNYIKGDLRFQFYVRPKHLLKGPNACRNYGYGKAQGDFIHFLDSDDLLKTEMLETYLSAFKPSTDAVIAPLQRFNSTTSNIEVTSISTNNLLEDYLVGDITYYVSGPLWRQSFLKDKVLFDEDIRNLDDWDFNLRMLYECPELLYLDEAQVLYRTHSNSFKHELGKLNLLEIKSEFIARKKHQIILRRLNRLDLENILVDFRYEKALSYLRIAVTANKKIKLLILYGLFVLSAIKAKKYLKIFKVSLGIMTFTITKKGYRFFLLNTNHGLFRY